MKTLRIAAAVGTFALALAAVSRAQTNFNVTLAGGGTAYQYLIDGTNNTGTSPGNGLVATNNCPPLTLRAGAIYTFSVSVSGIHPVGIVTTTPASTSFYSNATPASVSMGTITLTIPSTNFPSTLYYQCNVHHFYGVITVLPPLPDAPPQNTIISIFVSPTNVVLTSTGTNTTYSLVPEYNSNLVTGSWLSVPSFTNTFSNGTNTTSFGRLDAICGSNVFLRISQRPPQ